MHFSKGFTLIELCIVMIIIGLITSFGFPILTNFVKHQDYKETKVKLLNAREAISMYYVLTGKLPCPASMNKNNTNEYDYRLADCKPIIDKNHFSEGLDSSGLYISQNEEKQITVTGYLPIYDLGIAKSNALDSWHRHIKYVVSLNLTDFQSYATFSGNITLQNIAGKKLNWDLGGTQYALISQGKRECEIGLKDYMNCENYNTILIDSFHLSENNYYDDLVLYENYITSPKKLSILECSISDYFEKNNSTKHENRIFQKFVPANGTLKICNETILKSLYQNTEHCFNLICVNGKLINKEIIID